MIMKSYGIPEDVAHDVFTKDNKDFSAKECFEKSLIPPVEVIIGRMINEVNDAVTEGKSNILARVAIIVGTEELEKKIIQDRAQKTDSKELERLRTAIKWMRNKGFKIQLQNKSTYSYDEYYLQISWGCEDNNF